MDTRTLGKTGLPTELKLFSVSFVHWPETTVTYDASRQILFSCDAFGSYGALRGAIFDDECTDIRLAADVEYF